MNFCPQCGTRIEKPEQKFCMSCGIQLSTMKISETSGTADELSHFNLKLPLLRKELRRTLMPYRALVITSVILYLFTCYAFVSALQDYTAFWESFSRGMTSSDLFQDRINHEFLPAIFWASILLFLILVAILYVSQVIIRFGNDTPNKHRAGILLFTVLVLAFGSLGILNVKIAEAILDLLQYGFFKIIIPSFLSLVAIAFAVQSRWKHQQKEQSLIASLHDVKASISTALSKS